MLTLKNLESRDNLDQQVLLDYFNKALLTLEQLMSLIGIDFHYAYLAQLYEKREKTLQTCVKIMQYCKGLLATVFHLCSIFKLITKYRHHQGNVKNVNERLKSLIKTFLQENSLFPLSFVFDSEDLFKKLIVKKTT